MIWTFSSISTRTTIAILACAVAIGLGQEPAANTPQPAADPALDLASATIGRALFLRCFCAENNLTFDAQGQPSGLVKTVDWTLAAVNVSKVERKAPGQIELDGLRVAIRYNPDNHEFQRHPQNDEKLRITIADTGGPQQLARALEAVFSQGIDPALQRAMPDFWRHYFDPVLPWPPDGITPQTIYIPGPANLRLSPDGARTVPGTKDDPPVSAPSIAPHADNELTTSAERDRVKGQVVLRVVVDTEGKPRRIRIERPLGYGLDERAVQATTKARFSPAIRAGAPVPSVLLLGEDFGPASPAR
jgi:TonB family protein